MTIPVSQKKKDAGRIPGPAAVPNVTEIRCQFAMPNNKLSFITFHGFNGGSAIVNQTMANNLFGSLSAGWNTNLATFMHTGAVFQFVYVRDMTNITNPVFQSVGTAVPGTSASPAMPENNAIVMTENINARGRGAKGRVYLGGWATNADAGGGIIGAGVQTAINNFGTAVFNGISATNLTPCVAQVGRQQYQGVTGTVHPQRSATHINVTTYTCRDLVWDTQRRRIQP